MANRYEPQREYAQFKALVERILSSVGESLADSESSSQELVLEAIYRGLTYPQMGGNPVESEDQGIGLAEATARQYGSNITRKVNQGLERLYLFDRGVRPVNKETLVQTLESHWDEIENALSLLKRINDLYGRIEDLLQREDFEEADKRTAEIIWRVAGTWETEEETDERTFRTDRVMNFPCVELRNIDRIWTEYSDGRFGFSTQKRIWLSDRVRRDISKFMRLVGWARLGENDDGTPTFVYLNRQGIDFSCNAPEGQFPWLVAYRRSSADGQDREAYLRRIEDCI